MDWKHHHQVNVATVRRIVRRDIEMLSRERGRFVIRCQEDFDLLMKRIEEQTKTIPVVEPEVMSEKEDK